MPMPALEQSASAMLPHLRNARERRAGDGCVSNERDIHATGGTCPCDAHTCNARATCTYSAARTSGAERARLVRIAPIAQRLIGIMRAEHGVAAHERPRHRGHRARALRVCRSTRARICIDRAPRT